MTYIESLRQGSAVLSRIAEKNPQQLLINIIDDDPTADVERLFKKWKEQVLEDDDYHISALRHAFHNMLTNIDRGRKRPHSRKQKAKPAEFNQKVQEVKERIERVVLLNIMLPTGKLLRDSTFAECASVGGWFAKLAKKGKPNQVVGKVLTEAQLLAIR